MRHNQLHAQLRHHRHASGLSQAALAAKSGAGRVTIARMEGGSTQDFRVGTLSRLCEALGLEPAKALGIRTPHSILLRAGRVIE